MTSSLKYPVHSKQKTRSFVKKNGGNGDLRNRGYIFQESQGFMPGKANGFGWSIFTKLYVGYYSNTLTDTKLINGGRLFIVVIKL